MATWTTLSDGLLGSVVGAVAVFCAAAFTLWRARKGDQGREAVRLAEQDTERRQRYVAEVLGVLRALEREVRFAPFAAAHGQAEFIRACQLFYMAQKRDHPAVAVWLLARHEDYVVLADDWRRWWWCPVIGTRMARRVGDFLGQLFGALVLWSTDELPDQLFDDPNKKPRDVVAAGKLKRGLGTRADGDLRAALEAVSGSER